MYCKNIKLNQAKQIILKKIIITILLSPALTGESQKLIRKRIHKNKINIGQAKLKTMDLFHFKIHFSKMIKEIVSNNIKIQINLKMLR